MANKPQEQEDYGIIEEEITDKLVEEGVLSKIGKETYAINKDKFVHNECSTAQV
ncbi:hypothetical protein JHK82_032316 [Glycine max]|nr:hypothetical protein JHK82_032316 [Glycine max]